MLEFCLRKNNKSTFKILSIITTLTLAIFSVSCREEIPEPELEIKQEEPNLYNSPFKDVMGPVTLTYLINNPNIEIYSENIENDNFREMSLKVSMIKNKTIEEIINSKISTLHQNLKDMESPPYRGIRILIPDSSTLTSEYISTSMNFNYNNIISVDSVASRTFETPDLNNPMNFVDYIDTLTLDLKTGEDIMLEDLFTTDSNYKERLNEYIKAYLDKEFAEDEYSEWYSVISLVAPFKGIEDNQKYILTENALSLIIDYETPEFNTRNTFQRINIPYYDLQDILALEQRFYNDDDNIFDHQYEKSYTLIDHYDDRIKGEQLNEKISGVQVYYESRSPKDLPSSIEDKFNEFSKLDMKEVQKQSEFNNFNGFYFQESIASRIGNYVTFIANRNIVDKNGDYSFTTELKSYSMDGVLLKVDDLFIPGYSFEEVIKRNLIGSIPSEYKAESNEIEELIQSLTFRLSRTGVYFASKPVKVIGTETYPISFFIEYTELGCDNMTIFH